MYAFINKYCQRNDLIANESHLDGWAQGLTEGDSVGMGVVKGKDWAL